MAFDRAAALRNAEKLLRVGKLEAAIAEYARVVAVQPRDWNTANALGDLYVRTGQIDLAVEQFARIADGLAVEGFLQKANAVYKKILKLQPNHEHALLQAGEIAASLGLMADARTHFNAVVVRRQLHGDVRGVAEIRVRLGALDGADLESRLAAARARLELDDPAGALRDFRQLADELAERGRAPDALEVLRQAASLAPADADVRRRLTLLYARHGDVDRALESATTAAEFAGLAVIFEEQGRGDASIAARREAVRLAPDDHGRRADLAKALIAQGDTHAAAEWLSVDTPGADPETLLVAAVALLQGDQAERGLELVRHVLQQVPDRRDRVLDLAEQIAASDVERGFGVVELVVGQAVQAGELTAAVDVLDSWSVHRPAHIPALMQLVELSIDAGLSEQMYKAQARLAEAYLSAGKPAEARFIAEDLLLGEPDEPAHVIRLRRALELEGEPDPERVIAERRAAGAQVGVDPIELSPEASVVEMPLPVETTEAAEPPVTPITADESERIEIDLSVELDEILRPKAPPAVGGPVVATPADSSSEADPPVGESATIAGRDLDEVFAQLRGEAARRPVAETAQQEYQRGLTLREAGDVEGAMQALQSASRAPSLRFAASSMLARLFRERGQLRTAIEWFERGVEAPAPSAAETHALLYELADALEADGELARSLAVCLELQAEAGDYRDLTARIKRLTTLQARG